MRKFKAPLPAAPDIGTSFSWVSII